LRWGWVIPNIYFLKKSVDCFLYSKSERKRPLACMHGHDRCSTRMLAHGAQLLVSSRARAIRCGSMMRSGPPCTCVWHRPLDRSVHYSIRRNTPRSAAAWIRATSLGACQPCAVGISISEQAVFLNGDRNGMGTPRAPPSSPRPCRAAPPVLVLTRRPPQGPGGCSSSSGTDEPTHVQLLLDAGDRVQVLAVIIIS
jgi:hypothetical protein